MLKNNKITSSQIKKLILNEYRYKKSFYYIATEAGYFNSDILAINKKNEIFEFEVKTSLSDLKADFKKRKHKIYSRYPNEKKTSIIGVPTYFYFCIPEYLYKDCKNILLKYDNYGIIVCNEFGLTTKKTAKKLHLNNPIDWINKMKHKLIMRMSSEIVRFHNKEAE